MPLNVNEHDLPWVETVLGCTQTNFSITYLGMPLSVDRPKKEAFLPLIEKVDRKLSGWKSKMISRGGRLQLVHSVLSTIPIYHMSCFRLPKWVIQKIDKIRRSFLWAKPSKGKRGISLTNWEEACISKREGGMGIIDLNFFNIALLLRWWWKALADENFLWSLTIQQLRRRGNSRNGPLIWMVNGCFFWNQ